VLVAVALLFINLGNSSDAFLLLQAQQAGISASLVPLTLVVMNVAYSLSAYPVGLLSDRIGRLGLLVGGFCVYALAYLGFAFVDAPWQVWGLFGLYQERQKAEGNTASSPTLEDSLTLRYLLVTKANLRSKTPPSTRRKQHWAGFPA
jgi:hypothetical protein